LIGIEISPGISDATRKVRKEVRWRVSENGECLETLTNLRLSATKMIALLS